ncbi:MAG: DinB family protein [Ferruginibacter sp.]|nr:DinB family protein [Ferruginibacter sp.]
MQPQVQMIRQTRNWLMTLIKDLTIEQLNEIPKGFNNNIIWNMAHLIAAQQGVCYLRAGLTTTVDDAFFQEFKPGTRPERTIGADEAAVIKTMLFSTLDQLDLDLQKNMFKNYTGWETNYGVGMHNINDALNFVPFHEGLHLGYVMALKRLIH